MQRRSNGTNSQRAPANHGGINGRDNGYSNSPDVISVKEGWKVLEREAQRSLGMSARDFVRAWNEGTFDKRADRPEVMRVAMLLPLAR